MCAPDADHNVNNRGASYRTDDQPDVAYTTPPVAIAESANVVDADDVEAAAPPSDSQIKNVRDHAADLYKRRRHVAKLLKEVAEQNDAINVLEEKTIPDAMRAIGMRSFELEGGFRVDLEDYMHGSVTKANEPAFFDWLERNNLGSIIKHVLTISFGKNEDKWAKKFMADLAKRKNPIPVERKDGVHAQTLKAFFKERFAAEKEGKIPETKRIPRDVVTVHEGTKAVLFDPLADAEKKAASARGKKSKEVEM